MTTLSGRKPKNTFKDLLQVSNSNAGVDGTLRSIEDGEGTASALKISTSAVEFGGTIDANGEELILDADGDTSITADTDDRIDIKVAGSDVISIDADGDLILGATAVRTEDFIKQIEIRGASAGVTLDDGTARRAIIGVEDGTPTISADAADNDLVIRSLTADIKMIPAVYFDIIADRNGDIIGTFTNKNAVDPYGLIVDFSAASPDDNTNYFLALVDSTTVRFRVDSDGDAKNHDNSYGAISDLALKQDVTYVGPFANPDGTAMAVHDGDGSYAALFKKFRPAHYRFKTDVAADKNAGYQLGLIAQDVLAFAPGLVQGEGTEEAPYSLQYSLINMQALVALQELIGRVEALEAA